MTVISTGIVIGNVQLFLMNMHKTFDMETRFHCSVYKICAVRILYYFIFSAVTELQFNVGK